jgi:hypothetical protein
MDIQNRRLFAQQGRGNGRIRRALLWACVWASGYACAQLVMWVGG